MTARQKIEVKIANVKASIAKYAAMDEPDDEARKQYQADVKQLEVYNEQLAAAITAEGQPSNEGPEARERNALADRASLQRYMAAANGGRLDGVEHEYNAALEIPERDENGLRVPLELLAPSEVEVQHYADAHTGTTADTTVSERSWMDRLFNASVLAWAGIRPDLVPSGVASYPYTTAGPNPTGTTEKGSDVDAVALALDVKELKPKRIGAGITVTAEDSMRVPGLEPALRRDLRDALTSGMERWHIDTLLSNLTPLLIADDAADADLSKPTAVGDLTGALARSVDGIHAMTQSGIKIFGNPKWEELLNTGILVTGDAMIVADRFRDLGVMHRWTGHLGAVGSSGAADDYYLFIVRPVGIAEAIPCAIWNSFSLVIDPFSLAQQNRTAYRASSYTDMAVRRAENILVRRGQL